MAIYPCSHGRHFNPKQNRLWYVAWGRGSDFRRHRLRLCARHSNTVQENLAHCEIATLDDAGRGGYRPSADCLSCGEPVGELGWQLFVTGYPAQDERKDYWAPIHVECRLPEYLREDVPEST